MRESKIENFFVQGCKKNGWLCLKFVSPSMTGLPDRIILMPKGRIFFAELKAPGKKPRPIQQVVHNKLRKLGFSVCVIDSIETANVYLDVFSMLGSDKREIHTP